MCEGYQKRQAALPALQLERVRSVHGRRQLFQVGRDWQARELLPLRVQGVCAHVAGAASEERARALPGSPIARYEPHLPVLWRGASVARPPSPLVLLGVLNHVWLFRLASDSILIRYM